MPSNIIKSYSSKTGTTEQEVESKFEKAKEVVKKQYPDVEEDSSQFYQIVVGVLKKMVG